MNDIESPPSIFKVDLIEIISGTIVGAAMVWSFHNILWAAEPWGWEYYSSDTYPTWFIQSRDALFLSFSWFMFLLGFTASICLIRFFRRQVNQIPNIGHISYHGYILLTWPLILLIPDFQAFFAFFFICTLPPIIIGALIIFSMSRKTAPFPGNAVPTVINVVLFIPFLIYSAGLWHLTGD